MLISSICEGELITLLGGGSLSLALGAGIVPSYGITEGVLQNTRRWHGSIDDQFAAINNLVSLITAHQPAWSISEELLTQITNNRDRLQSLINLCRSNQVSKADREIRNTLLKSTVGICVRDVKIWAYSLYANNVLTADDVHLLGFLIPGEHGGFHGRKEPTDTLAEVKVKIINEDFVRVVVDQSAGENAARVVHGWPSGVNTALIVITAVDGKTEVIRLMTTNLHTDIRMPEGSHGKQFIVKASFLKHVDDEPRFGNEPTFSMPMTTEDLAAAIDRQHHEDFEEQLRAVEHQRQEIERLHAELDAQKRK
jgi:hypothetical protein